MKITEAMLDSLRADVRAHMSEKRFNHTAEVEKMAERLGAIYAPDSIMTLRAAALLHDITKEYSAQEQIEICEALEIELCEYDVLAPKTLHARTAAALISRVYPELADEQVISCVRWHTTGKADMSIEEKIIYLADYIDMSRTFEDCVLLREYFMSADLWDMSDAQKQIHLVKTLIMSFDMTIKSLIADGKIISADTTNARNSLKVELCALTAMENGGSL